jgi:hypothetical protein
MLAYTDDTVNAAAIDEHMVCVRHQARTIVERHPVAARSLHGEVSQAVEVKGMRHDLLGWRSDW